MEVMADEIDGFDLCVGDLYAGWIGVLIELTVNLEAGLGCGGGDELDDCLIAYERLAAPVLSDERKQAMFDLVPFAGAGRQVAHGDGNAEFVGQFLQFDLP